MGIDLKLLPFDEDNNDLAYSHTILNCFRQTELFDSIQDLESRLGRPVSKNFDSYLRLTEEGYQYGKTTRTPYDELLKFVLASDLLEFAAHSGVQENWKNRAVWAYLSELPATTKVALYWD